MRRYVTAEDFYFHNECDRKVYLAHHGDPALAEPPSAFQRWLMAQGRAYEAEFVGDAVDLRAFYPPGDLEAGFAATHQAMREGRATIYHGVLVHGEMAGIPDLLRRVDEPSTLGDWHYYPVDIKLGSSLKDSYQLQIMMYLHLLEGIQGLRPAVGGIILKNRQEVMVPFDEPLFEGTMQAVRPLTSGHEVPPFISSICDECKWRSVCLPVAESAQDASLLSGLQRRSWEALRDQDLGTLSAVASADLQELQAIPGIGAKTASRLQLQARALLTGEMTILNSPELPVSPVEIFFDVESVPTLDLFYLMGTIIQQEDQMDFVYDLATSPDEERVMWRSFLDRMSETEGLIFHYANYERQTVQALDKRYGPDPRVTSLLERMFDIGQSIKDNLVLPLRSTSLKAVAPWLGFEWRGFTAAADDSMVEYVTYLEDEDERHLDHILLYNEDDCLATLQIRNWLADLSSPH